MKTITISDELYEALEPIGRSLGQTPNQIVATWLRELLNQRGDGQVFDNVDDFLRAAGVSASELAKADQRIQAQKHDANV
jgi:negative regulator of replication initiation